MCRRQVIGGCDLFPACVTTDGNPGILNQLAEQSLIQMFKPNDDRRVAIVVRVIHIELGWASCDQGIFFGNPRDKERPDVRIRELWLFGLYALHPFPANAFAPTTHRDAKSALRTIPFDNTRVGERDAADVIYGCHRPESYRMLLVS